MAKSNNKTINRIAHGEASPMGGIHQEYSCELLDQMNTIDYLAQGSITASQNVTYNIKCWQCHNEFQVKGLYYDDECPKCGYRTNNSEFPKTLYSLAHLDHISEFLTMTIPETFGHYKIYNNSSRVAEASSGKNINKQTSIKKLQQLYQLLSFTKGF